MSFVRMILCRLLLPTEPGGRRLLALWQMYFYRTSLKEQQRKNKAVEIPRGNDLCFQAEPVNII
jgi:hypothetical protein